MYKLVIFDMDGTLVNTYEGIYLAYKYALNQLEMPFGETEFVDQVIGAPLLDVFKKIVKLSDKKALEAIQYYRNYYNTRGKFQFTVYAGIADCLEKLKQNKIKIGLATLKREDFAIQILEKAKLLDKFDVVCGIDSNDGLSKSDLIKECMGSLHIRPSESILVGDSKYDFEGAKEVKVDFLPVLYGFGYKQANTTFEKAARTVGEISNIILNSGV